MIRRRTKKVPERIAHAFIGWFRLARESLSDERVRLERGQPLLRALVLRVDIEPDLLQALRDCCEANTRVWNRAVGLAINGLPRKDIIGRAMASRKKSTGMLRVVSSAVVYSTAWCASMMRKSVNVALDKTELEQLQIDPKRRPFMFARQGCTIERGEIKFPGVGYLKIRDKTLFDRFYSLHGRWTAIVMRGSHIYVVIDAPTPLELMRHSKTDYDIRLQAIHAAYDQRTKKDPLFRHAKARTPLLAKFGRSSTGPDATLDQQDHLE